MTPCNRQGRELEMAFSACIAVPEAPFPFSGHPVCILRPLLCLPQNSLLCFPEQKALFLESRMRCSTAPSVFTCQLRLTRKRGPAVVALWCDLTGGSEGPEPRSAHRNIQATRHPHGSHPDGVARLGLAVDTRADVSGFPFSSFTDALISHGVWNLRDWNNLVTWNEIASMGYSGAALGSELGGKEKVAKGDSFIQPFHGS